MLKIFDVVKLPLLRVFHSRLFDASTKCFKDIWQLRSRHELPEAEKWRPDPLLSLSDDVKNNETAFGKIVRGEGAPRLLYQDAEYIAFRNVKPYAKLAGLVVPRRFVPQDPFNLSKECLPIIEQLKTIGELIIQTEQPDAYRDRDYWMRFHLPPHNSVEHLHLHVIAPASSVTKWEIRVIFNDVQYACDVDVILENLRTP
eukprot:gnl/MRDRNA2_/MRDRNA2_39812_c0_seq1.p1 gnl/MRDRNA2_/MRDRNA2_39812_c0~~gnl/MRDRNA2_/MRDRNA2_39812_c0_seq1.p1  ORF type:complete len:200 (+),score=33.82 gnl/MRDRNA2_/MRDRNA2_39812_c0_seq1:163-762(+)